MGCHDAPSVDLGKLDSIDRFTDGSDLIDLKKKGIGSFGLDSLGNFSRISNSEIISYDLHVGSNIATELDPVGPVILIKRILDSDDRIVRAHFFVECNELVTGEKGRGVSRFFRSLEIEIIFVLIRNLELGRGYVEPDGDSIQVSRLVRSLHDHGKSALYIAWRGESSFVSDKSCIASELRLDDSLQVVEDFAADLHTFGVSFCASGDNKKLLEGQSVSSMFSAIDDIETRDWEGVRSRVPSDVGEMLPKGDGTSSGSGFAGSKRNSENSICAEVPLIGGPIRRNHGIVDCPLISWIHTNHRALQRAVHVSHGFQTSLTHVPTSAITKFGSLVDSSGSSGRD
mmetsp:Transcript_17804/g.40440  ORF Transcript_17804/g.40440 Transcript_17804/m.40440 type:complete len:342 (+) Transcript_17804:368-1393(+)